MKKDLLVWWLRVVVGLSLLTYVLYIYFNHIDIVPTKQWWYDIVILAIIAFIWLIMIYVWTIKPCFKRPRVIQFFMWVFLILFPQYVGMVDNASLHLFLHDILQIIWSLAIILSFSKACIYDKCEKVEEQIKNWEMEIIEV